MYVTVSGRSYTPHQDSSMPPMEKITPTITLSFLFIIIIIISPGTCIAAAYSGAHRDFLRCLSYHSKNHSEISRLFFRTQQGRNSTYQSILESSIRNLRFTSPSTPKPLIILTPRHESQIPAIVLCSQQNGLQIRTRSGGHDYEGLSYTSPLPFLIIDLVHMSEITVDAATKTAWVQAGATIGQLYYQISRQSRSLAFPAGTCPTVGAGGHLSGGGYGTLLRKYGLAADNVIDARLVDARGKILDRKSMPEELFWAVRGGGGASFGVITAWKLRLVVVPATVTVFSVERTLEQKATELVHRWQFVAPNLPKDLMILFNVRRINASRNGSEIKTVSATFESIFLGGIDRLLEMLDDKFPELGVERDDCKEVSWAQSVLFFAGYDVGVSPQFLADRNPLFKLYFKAKSDYVQKPIPKSAFGSIWKYLLEEEAETALLIFTPYGGRMSEISESSIPFPHRAGNLFKIQHLVYWDEARNHESERYISWIRRLYSYMAPYVSKFPRSAYVNYRDLDLGVNNEGNTSYAQASVWGFKYFGPNFNRLVRVKTIVDPNNFFRNEQSIPPFDF